MKVSVCFTPKSFDFNLEQDVLALALRASSVLIKQMNKGFVTFFKSNDFDMHAATELYKQGSPLDAAAIMSLLYDQQMNNASTIQDLDESAVTQNTNTIPPVYQQTWISLYSPNPSVVLTLNPSQTIHSEKCLVKYCSEVLVNNPRAHKEYAESFDMIYNNLIFLKHPTHASYKTFDSIRKIKGGYTSFIQGITDCLSYMNSYDIIPHDSQKNIENLNAALCFPVTPEGAGKNERVIAALKRDFSISGSVYTNVNCEYHYKLEHIDGTRGKGKYYFNRIYFGFFNRIDPNNPQIAIAHIGEHL